MCFSQNKLPVKHWKQRQTRLTVHNFKCVHVDMLHSLHTSISATSGASKSEPIYARAWQVTKSALGFQPKQRHNINMKKRISFTKPDTSYNNKLLVVWRRILKSFHLKAQMSNSSFNGSVFHQKKKFKITIKKNTRRNTY